MQTFRVYFHFTTLLLLSLFSTLFAQILNSNDSLNITEMSLEQDLNIALFERSSPFWKDYRTNQTIQSAIKWGSVSSVVAVGVLAGGSMEGNVFIFLAAFAIPPVSFLYGAYDGYHYGKGLNKHKNVHPEFRLKRKHIGYEAEITATTSNGLTFPNAKGSLCFQPLKIRKYMPSEYRFGLSFLRDVWLKDYDEDENEPFYSYSENRADLSFLYNSNRTYFQFHWGFGGGYSWGSHEMDIDDKTVESVNIKGAFIYPLAGITVNFNDFFYLRAEGRYELSQFYYELIKYADYPASTNVSLGFSFGTYIF